MTTPRIEEASTLPRAGLWELIVCGLASWLLYLGLVQLSSQFAWHTAGRERPLIQMLLMLAALFALYLYGVNRAMAVSSRSGALQIIVGFSLAFRLLVVFSEPIQEVDAYRYLWDGQVVAAGVNPFRYSPEQVLNADAADELPKDLARLVDVRDRSAAVAVILSRVHYGELTTVYPPVSQLVFAAVALATPEHASVRTHLLLMKSAIVAFDLLTLLLVIMLLTVAGRPREWSIVYGWCPLLIKEYANSGHLDSIAVCFTTAAVLCASRAFFPRAATAEVDSECDQKKRCTRWLWLCSVLIVAAVGAKIYAVVLFPLLFLSTWRAFSFLRATSVAVVTLLLCVGMVAPMLSRSADSSKAVEMRADEELIDVPPLPDEDSDIGFIPDAAQETEADSGLATFAAQWQMNDFLFSLLFENLRPNRLHNPTVETLQTTVPGRVEVPPRPGEESPEDMLTTGAVVPWFVVTSNAWRNRLVAGAAEAWGVSEDAVPFLLTRLVTGALFLIIAVWLALWAVQRGRADSWLEACFLTIAWFWLLLPTQNPWYWAWAMPLLPFARSRVWLAVSGVVLVYYLRFWLVYHYDDMPLAGTAYHGAEFFDYCVTWIEFGPLLLCLLVDWWRWRAAHRG